jgi:hypothetical protein
VRLQLRDPALVGGHGHGPNTQRHKSGATSCHWPPRTFVARPRKTHTLNIAIGDLATWAITCRDSGMHVRTCEQDTWKLPGRLTDIAMFR